MRDLYFPIQLRFDMNTQIIALMHFTVIEEDRFWFTAKIPKPFDQLLLIRMRRKRGQFPDLTFYLPVFAKEFDLGSTFQNCSSPGSLALVSDKKEGIVLLVHVIVQIMQYPSSFDHSATCQYDLRGTVHNNGF